MKKVLITGITGFAGSHLAELLLADGSYEIHGIARWRSKKENIKGIEKKIKLHECDIRDYTSVQNMVKNIKPDYIYHLAAQSFVPTSWVSPSETLNTNIIGELNVLETVRHLELKPRILVAGSSEEYGLVHEDEVPINEDNPLRPLSPYAVSKVAQDLMGYQYHQSYGMDVIRTRGFNHTGPRRGEVFVCSDFARQFVKIEKGITEPVICTGRLDTIRDFTDVRDMVRAYKLAIEKGEAGDVYVIASGKGYRIREVLDMLMEITGIKPEIKEEKGRVRPSDVPVLIGDATKFRKKTGWQTEIPFEKTLEDLVNYWRERVINEHEFAKK